MHGGVAAGIQKAGVRSLKIEGRMKRPEYVAVVTKVYREALSALEDGKEFDEKAAREELEKIYNRGGFCSGYLKGNRDVTYLRRPGHLGVKLGEVLQVRAGRAVLHTQAKVLKGDGLEFRRGDASHGGLTLPYADEVVEGIAFLRAEKPGPGTRCSVPRMRRRCSAPRGSWRMLLRSRFGETSGRRWERARSLCCRGRDILCAPALRSPVKQRKKRRKRAHRSQPLQDGRHDFGIEKLELEIDGQPFLAASVLNQLRREALAQMEQGRF